jgi:phosphatidylglycerophosphatase A
MPAEGRIVPRLDWRRPHHWVAYGFGAGLSPRAPGTAGTLAAVPLYLLLRPLSLGLYLAVLLTAFMVGVWACGKTGRELKSHDHRAIVWDEVLGYLVTMTAAPQGWRWVVLGFLLFRFFDILKPWPIRVLDRRIHGGLGVMLDDLAAGLIAAATMRVIVLAGG